MNAIAMRESAGDPTGEAGTGLPPDQDRLRRRLAAVMDRHELTLAAVAKRSGLSAAALSQWRSDSYRGSNETVAGKVGRFLESLSARLDVQALTVKKPGFQQTQTAERIWAMLTQAQHAPTMVVVAGVPGIGKTETAEAYRKSGANVVIATMDPTTNSPAKVLQEIAEAMSIEIGSPVTLRNRIGERLRYSGGLLIIDESQHCNHKSLDLIRSLHDRYGVGIALMGNFGLFAGTQAPTAQHGFAQFFRRIRKRAKFTQPASVDIEIMLDAWGVTETDQRRFLTTVARKMWGLAAIGNTIHEATAMALGADEAMEVKHLKAAWAGLNHYEG